MFYTLLWRDCIEILFYSLFIYSFCCWLKSDKTKKLVAYFLGYCCVTVACHKAQLPTVAPLLISYAPVALLLFIVLHDKTLQKNFVALRSVTPKINRCHDWIGILLSSIITVINKNKGVTVVIENQDCLDRFLKNSSEINAQAGKYLLDLLFSSAMYDEKKMVWIDSSGKIRGINVSWLDEKNVHDDSFLFTTHTDAIVLASNPIARTFTTIHRGKELRNIPAHHVNAIIKKQLTDNVNKNKGMYDGNTTNQKSDSQQNSPSNL